MRKIGLLVATAAVTLGISAGSASAVTVTPPPNVQIAANLCQQQGGVFYYGGGYYSCTSPMTAFDLLKAKSVCSLLFGGSLSLLSPVVPSILLLPNNGYKCTFSYTSV